MKGLKKEPNPSAIYAVLKQLYLETESLKQQKGCVMIEVSKKERERERELHYIIVLSIKDPINICGCSILLSLELVFLKTVVHAQLSAEV